MTCLVVYDLLDKYLGQGFFKNNFLLKISTPSNIVELCIARKFHTYTLERIYILKMPMQFYDFINLHDISRSRNHTLKI